MTIVLSKYPRDVDTLLKEYNNLINALYKKQAYKLSDKIKRDDLREYIINEFILLTREYKPQMGVDFPYYIKKSLTLRTIHSYITSVSKDERREIRASGSAELDNAHLRKLSDEFRRKYDTNYVFDDLAQTDIEKDIMNLWLHGVSKRSEIVDQLSNTYEEQKIISSYNQLRSRLKKRANKYRMLK